MTTPPNHIRIYRDRAGKHVTLDGHELLLDNDNGIFIDGADNPNDVTKVHLTLTCPKVTVESDLVDM